VASGWINEIPMASTIRCGNVGSKSWVNVYQHVPVVLDAACATCATLDPLFMLLRYLQIDDFMDKCHMYATRLWPTLPVSPANILVYEYEYAV